MSLSMILCAVASAFRNMLDNSARFMQSSAFMKTTLLPLKRSINLSPVRLALLLFPLALLCFGLSPQARATCQEGCNLNLNNTFLGNDALLSDTTGTGNTAVGTQALTSNTTGGANVAIGYQALFSNSTATANVAVGTSALYQNSSGTENTAIGISALYSNQGGSQNVAIGPLASWRNETGMNNSAVGYQALFNNMSGSNNCAFGYWALLGATDVGSNNTAIGSLALLSSFGDNNVAIGYNAGVQVQGGDNNIFVGESAGRVVVGFGSNNIEIGNRGMSDDDGIIRIGSKQQQKKTYIVGINGNTVAGGVGVIVGTDGRLGTTTSSARFKDEIKPMDKTSEAILALKPATFRYKHELDPDGIPQFGLVAEEVEKVNPDLVVRDDDGKPYSVRYEAVNAMLLNEFLKEHRTVQLQQKEIDALKTELKEQSSLIQKVSARLELSRPAAQTVGDNQ
jgi:hypothetical protein